MGSRGAHGARRGARARRSMSRRIRGRDRASPRAAPRRTTWRSSASGARGATSGRNAARVDADRAQGRARARCTRSRRRAARSACSPSTPTGRVDATSFDALVRDDTAVCSVMWVNNEIGTVQDVPALARAWREVARRRLPHRRGAGVRQGRDRRAAARRSTCSSISGHKIGAPKGIGALYIRRGTPMEPLMYGGAQDRGRRPGTENVAMAVGLARAAELAVAEREHGVRAPRGAARPARGGDPRARP